jgi:hypothetical protein
MNYIRGNVVVHYKQKTKFCGLVLTQLIDYYGFLMVANQGLEPRTCGL